MRIWVKVIVSATPTLLQPSNLDHTWESNPLSTRPDIPGNVQRQQGRGQAVTQQTLISGLAFALVLKATTDGAAFDFNLVFTNKLQTGVLPEGSN